MRLVKFISMMLILVTFGCTAQNEKKVYDEIAYSAYTRGTNITIKVHQGKVVYKGNYGEKEVVLTAKEQNKLNEMIKGLDLKTLASLKAPSQERISDGALHGEFAIQVGETEYKSSIFDAGNPPKQLKPLEDYLNKIVGAVD